MLNNLSEHQKQVLVTSAAFAWVMNQLKVHQHLGMQKQIAIPVLSALAVKAAIGDFDSGWSLSQSDMQFWVMSMGTAWLTIKFL